jgi:hypothetical protein
MNISDAVKQLTSAKRIYRLIDTRKNEEECTPDKIEGTLVNEEQHEKLEIAVLNGNIITEHQDYTILVHTFESDEIAKNYFEENFKIAG